MSQKVTKSLNASFEKYVRFLILSISVTQRKHIVALRSLCILKFMELSNEQYARSMFKRGGINYKIVKWGCYFILCEVNSGYMWLPT